MQALSRQETSPQPDSAPSTELIVRKWLVAFGSLFNREITPLVTATWCELLAHLTPEQAERGLKQVAKTWTFAHFPTPGAVLSQFDKAEEKGFELEAEREWENLLEWVRENYYPDALTVGNVKTHIKPGAPWLPAATQHAARAAGGYSYIERCPQDELVWCRKTFLASYKNVHETGQVEHLLSDGEAKRILAGFSEPRALPAANGDWEHKYPPPAMPANPKPIHIVKWPEITDEEWERRKAEQKEHVTAWLAAHPEVQKPGGAGCSKNPSVPEVASA